MHHHSPAVIVNSITIIAFTTNGTDDITVIIALTATTIANATTVTAIATTTINAIHAITTINSDATLLLSYP